MTSTGDIDIGPFEKLSLATHDQVSSSWEETFSRLKFSPLPGL
ncbi:hypothetical protein [Albirhodobacter sp. R86504]